jgi:hypothetical protein
MMGCYRRASVLRWLALFLLAVSGCTGVPRARQEGYRALAAWLETHALPDETLAVQERTAWEPLVELPLVTLPVGGDASALLKRLNERRPDYCVSLRSVAWEGVLASPWFRERYRRVAARTAVDDPAAPLMLYRYYPSPFDGGEVMTLERTLRDPAVGHLALQSARLSRRRVAPGDPVYVSVELAGELREPLEAVWRLHDLETDRLWLQEVRAQPGGLPTDAWPISGTVTARYVVAPPDNLPPGDYALELAFRRPNGAPFDEAVRVATLFHPPEVTRDPPTPDHPLEVSVGEDEAIALVGYDAPERLAPGETLQVALYWHAQAVVEENLKVFVHLFDPAGTLVAQSDGVPADWSYPTTAWQPGEYIRDVHVIPLAGELPRGDYRVVAGMYAEESDERLPLRDAEDALLPEDAAELFLLRLR